MTLFVNGQQVKPELIQQEIDRLAPDYEMYVNDVKGQEKQDQLHRWAQENIIEQLLLRQAAFHQNFDVSPEQIADQLQQLETRCGNHSELLKQLQEKSMTLEQLKQEITIDIKLQKLIAQINDQIEPVTEQHAREFYDNNLEKFNSGEKVHAGHIVRRPSDSNDVEKVYAELQQILTRLRNGESFEKLAAIASDCPESGGDLGIFGRGQMVQRFEDIVFDLQPGQISDLFETEFGIHIATVYEKIPPRLLDFNEVKKNIIEFLTQEKQQKYIEKFVDDLRKKAIIEEK